VHAFVLQISDVIKIQIFSLLEHYQDRIRGIDLDGCGPLAYEKLLKFPRLMLQKLNVRWGLHEHLDTILRGQPSITYLDLAGNIEASMECILSNLPLLKTLKIWCFNSTDFDLIAKNVHRLEALTCLEIRVDWTYYCDSLDFSFISELKNLKKIVCLRKNRPCMLIFDCFRAPMLRIKDFQLYDPTLGRNKKMYADSVSNIMQKMPNLEKLNLVCDVLKVNCSFFRCLFEIKAFQFLI
jgi:hypothetical protein